MARILYQAGAGLLAGVLIGLVCFTSVSVVTFGLGWYSSNVLVQGALYGTITGAVFGPIFFMLRTPWLKAAYWETAIVGVIMLLLIGGTMMGGAVSAPGKEGELIVSIVRQMLAIIVSASLSGGIGGWAANRLPKYNSKVSPSSVPTQSESRTYEIR